MKHINIFFIALVICVTAYNAGYAQAKIGDNPSTIHAKAILELDKTDKGFLPTRLTTAQMNAMFPSADATAKGMTIYNIDTKCTYIYDGTIWKSMCDPNDHDWYMNSGATNQTYVSNNDSTVYRGGRVVIGSNYNALNSVESLINSVYPLKKSKVYINGNGSYGLFHFDTIKAANSFGITSLSYIDPESDNASFGSFAGVSTLLGARPVASHRNANLVSHINSTGLVSDAEGVFTELNFNSQSTGTTGSVYGVRTDLKTNDFKGSISEFAGISNRAISNSPNGEFANAYGYNGLLRISSSKATSTLSNVFGGNFATEYQSNSKIDNLNGLKIATTYNSSNDFGIGDGFAYFHGLMGIYNLLDVQNGTGAINAGHTVAGTRQELWYRRQDARQEAFYGNTNRMYVIYPGGTSTAGEPKLAIGYDVQMGPYAGSPGLFVNAIGFMAGNRGRDTSIAYTIRFGQSENASGNGVSFGYHVPVNTLYRASGAKVRAFINEDAAVQSTFMGNVGIGIDGAARKLHVKDTGARTSVRLEDIPVYANDAAAGIGGLTTGDVYCTNVGGDLVLKVKI